MKIVVLDGYTLAADGNSWGALLPLGEVEIYERSLANEVLSRSCGATVLITNKDSNSNTASADTPTPATSAPPAPAADGKLPAFAAPAFLCVLRGYPCSAGVWQRGRSAARIEPRRLFAKARSSRRPRR